MIYTRGAQDDWNRYAELTGDDGWKWDNVLQYAKKVRLRLFSVAIFRSELTGLLARELHQRPTR